MMAIAYEVFIAICDFLQILKPTYVLLLPIDCCRSYRWARFQLVKESTDWNWPNNFLIREVVCTQWKNFSSIKSLLCIFDGNLQFKQHNQFHLVLKFDRIQILVNTKFWKRRWFAYRCWKWLQFSTICSSVPWKAWCGHLKEIYNLSNIASFNWFWNLKGKVSW